MRHVAPEWRRQSAPTVEELPPAEEAEIEARLGELGYL
jgi:hypothetical protein